MHDDPTSKDRLVKRLRYLWTWELFDSFFLPGLAVFCARLLGEPLGLFTVCSSLLVTWLLWQGAAYWWLKLRSVRTDSRVGETHLRRFRILKKVNWLLLAGLAVVGLLTVRAGSSGFNLLAGGAFFLLALLEQVNYYHVQLMYDWPADWRYLVHYKQLKPSSLARALAGLQDH